MVQGHATLTEAKDAMIAGWDAARRENPQARQIMLAYRRDDVRDLNERARAVRQAAGELGESYRVETERGAREFSPGDRVYFLRNERSLGVKNGTLGTVERIEGYTPGQGDRLAVRLDDGADSRLRPEGLRAYRPRLRGDGAQVARRDGGPDACAGDQPHGPARRLCRAEPAPGARGPALERRPVGSRERLTRVLGRERLKDTSLDYGFGRTEAEPGIRTRVGSRLGARLCRAARAGAGKRDRAARAAGGVERAGTGSATAGDVRRTEAGGRPAHGGTSPGRPAGGDRAGPGSGPAGVVGGGLCAGLVGCRADAPGRVAGAAAPGGGAVRGQSGARRAAPRLRAGPRCSADPGAATDAGCRGRMLGWRR